MPDMKYCQRARDFTKKDRLTYTKKFNLTVIYCIDTVVNDEWDITLREN